MPVTAICPQCQATYKLAEALFGKQVRCKKCQKAFTVGKGANASGATVKASPSARPVAKKTMMVGGEAIQESKKQGPSSKPAPVPSGGTPRRPARMEVDDLVEAEAAPRRSAVADDDDLVEAVAATPRSVAPKPVSPPPAPRRGKFLEDDEAPMPRRRPGRDDRDDRKRRPYEDDEDAAPRRRGAQADFNDPDPALPGNSRNSRKGLVVGLLLGFVLLVGGGGAAAYFLFLKGPSVGPDGLIDDPQVVAKMERLKARDHEYEEAIFFFANFEAPEKQKRRSEVAQILEAELRSNIGRPDLADSLTRAYCRWCSAENIPGLMGILEDNRIPHISHGPLRKQLFDTLAAFKDDRSAAFFAQRTRQFSDRGNAISALEAMGDPGKKELTKFYFDNDFGLRGDAQRALTRMGVRDEEFLDPALAVLADRTHSQRRAAVDFLQKYSGDKKRSKEVCEKLNAVIQEKTFVISDHAANAVPNWITKESLPIVVKMVEDAERNRNCENMIKELAKYKDTPGVVDAIAKRMESSHFNEPRIAMDLLESMGPDVAAKAMISQLNSSNHSTKTKVRAILAKAGTSLEVLVAQSIKDLASPTEAVRNSAVEYLESSPPIPKLRDDAAAGLNRLIHEDNIFRRDHVFRALTIWWNKDTMIELCKTINDPGNRALRHKSIEVLAKMGDPRLAANIAYRLKFDEDRGHAANALRGMGTPAESAVMPYLLDTEANVRNDALRVIEDIGTPASFPTMTKAAAVYASDRGFVLTINRVGKKISMR